MAEPERPQRLCRVALASGLAAESFRADPRHHRLDVGRLPRQGCRTLRGFASAGEVAQGQQGVGEQRRCAQRDGSVGAGRELERRERLGRRPREQQRLSRRRLSALE